MRKGEISFDASTSFSKETGYLSPGIYELNLNLIKEVFGFNDHRLILIKHLEDACNTFWKYNLIEIFIDGSFVTLKPNPGDVDGVVILNPLTDAEALQKLKDSCSIWGQTTRIKGKPPSWHRYKVEFYFQITTNPSVGFNFFEFFQTSRNNQPRGIVKIVK